MASWIGEKGAAAAETTAATGASDGDGEGWERASATTLSGPGMWTAVTKNSEMKAIWSCWRPEFGDERRCRAATRGR